MTTLRTVYLGMLTVALCAHLLFGPVADKQPDLHALVIGSGPGALVGALLAIVLCLAVLAARFERRANEEGLSGSDVALAGVGWLVSIGLLAAVAVLSSKKATMDGGFGQVYTVTLRPGLHSVVALAGVVGAIEGAASVLRLRDARLRRAIGSATPKDE